MRALRLGVLVTVIVSSVGLSTAPTSADDSSSLDLGTLRPGDSRLWAGDYVDTNAQGQRKFTYTLRTIEDIYGSSEGDIHQSVGWGDLYEWQVEEQFVPIATVDQKLELGGYYLLRMEVDHGGQLIESDDTDNVSYAYFQVTGTRSLKLIQRGYGEHPWDPRKRVEP